MSAIGNHDTRPELALRRALHARGLRYRLRHRVVGRPDLVFASLKIAVFCDGDHWHGNGWRLRGFPSLEAYYGRGNNGQFWINKITRNMARDDEVNTLLVQAGWTVLRFWESEIAKDLDRVVEQVARAVQDRRHELRGRAA